MATSRPRVAALSRSDSASRFTREDAAPFAPASHASPYTLAPGGNSPINASASMDFPLPDSPTSPSDSPVSSVNDTSSTGRIHPEGVGSSTVRPRNSINIAIDTSYDGLCSPKQKGTMRSAYKNLASPSGRFNGARALVEANYILVVLVVRGVPIGSRRKPGAISSSLRSQCEE